MRVFFDPSFHKKQRPPALANLLISLVILEGTLGHYAEAELNCQEAISINHCLGNCVGLINQLYNLRALLVIQKQPQKAISILQEDLTVTTKDVHLKSVPNPLANLGITHYHLNHFDQAKVLSLKALKIVETNSARSI